ncbi:MAG TPA: glycosyltransferase family 4 protein [Ignavibacteria bacterium]|nr:glycosyltransferase family 4 protein [Ignavibacteria bacterium]HMR39833.1 glycosyltransferase family 4 protein [Ignavibacteria bacterium]
MKILFAGSYNEGGSFTGPEKVANRIFKSASGKYETAFATYFSDGRKYGVLKKLFGKEKSGSDETGKVYRFGLLSILMFALRFKPDIIHIITYERFALILFLCQLFRKVKFIYNVHGIAVYENNINENADTSLRKRDSICEKIFFRYSDILVFLSELSVKTARKFYEFSDTKVVIIPNGIDKEFHEAGKSRNVRNENILKVVFIGELKKREKGFNYLFSALGKPDLSTELYAVSNSEPDKNISGEIEKSDKINFHLISKMDTEKFAEFLMDKDIYVSASFYEQFSIAAVECMAAGLVPVVSSETGMSSYINNGINGFVYKNENELISILEKLNSNRKLVSEISGRAKLIYNELNMNIIFEKYKDLYK